MTGERAQRHISLIPTLGAFVGDTERVHWLTIRVIVKRTGPSGIRRGVVAVFIFTQGDSAVHNLVTPPEYLVLALFDSCHGHLARSR